MPSSKAFVPPLPPKTTTFTPRTRRQTPRPPAASPTRPTQARAQITKVSRDQLVDLVSAPAPGGDVVVLKCYASYCRGCKGVEPKFRKIAAAYEEEVRTERVQFCEMDYAVHEQFCREELGVTSLPFFGIWRDGRYVGGEAIGWQTVGKKLVDKIEKVVAGDNVLVSARR